MSELTDNTKKTDLINDNIKPVDGIQNSVEEQTVASDIAILAVPESDEFTELPIPEKINESHLLVVNGHENICLTDTIPPPKKNRRVQSLIKTLVFNEFCRFNRKSNALEIDL